MNEKLKSNSILYIDTSEPNATIALYESLREGEADTAISLSNKVTWEAARELSKTLSSKVEVLLKSEGLEPADLSGICVFVGPGSFTGLRIGISFANGLAFALGIPVYETKKKEEFKLHNPKVTALPLYGAEPNITKPKIK